MAHQHTPGPWTVRMYDGSLGTIDSSHGPVAQAQEVSVQDRNVGHVERRSNAHLIAAAPDLLGALKAVVSDLEDLIPTMRVAGWQVHNEEATIRRALLVINKALGRI